MNWKGKKILVTGSEGMIGKELVIQLKELGVDVIHYDKKFDERLDVYNQSYLEGLLKIHNIDFVFHLFGIKGNPKMTKERPLDFMIPMLRGDLNVVEACQRCGVKRMLYTSSIAVENPESDKYPAWAKMTAETLIEAMRIQYPKGTKYCIVRPANVYGRFDNFDNPNAMVVTNLINKALKDNKLILDKKGCCQERDIINAKDVARGMIKAMEEMPDKPVNLCTGEATRIDRMAKIIAKELNITIEYKDLKITLGPNKKVMSNPYIKPEELIPLDIGLKEVIQYARNNNRTTS